MMKKTILSRILSTNFAILIGALLLAMLLMSTLYGQVLLNQQKSILRATADELTAMAETKMITISELQSSINRLAKGTDTKIYWINLNEQRKDQLLASLQKETLSPFIQEDLKFVLEGNEVYRGLQFSKFFGAYTVFLGRPIYQAEKLSGVLLLFKPLNELTAGIIFIGAVFLSIILGVLVLGFLLIRWSTKKITAPLSRLSSAAKQITLGKVIVDLPIEEQDEIGHLTEAFNQMKNRIEAHNQEKSAFMAMVSHDIKTPLMSINGYVEALMDGVIQKEDLSSTLNLVHDEIERLTRLTQELLTVSKSQDMSFIVKIERFEWMSLLKQAGESLKHYGEKQLLFSISGPKEIWVKADRDKSMQILMNILSNAYKFSKENCEIKIVCSVSQSYILEIQFIDWGLGIAEDQLLAIFNHHVKLHDEIMGEGLGLAITKKLIEMHGGQISVESVVHEMTTFKVLLPIVLEVYR